MNWHRHAQRRLIELSSQFPAIVLLGSRQVGKTTLVRESFPQALYSDLESPLVRMRFSEDPANEVSLLGELYTHPARRANWQRCVIDDLIQRKQLIHPYTQFFFWRTATGYEADLIMDRGNERIAVEVKAYSGTNLHDARRLEGGG